VECIAAIISKGLPPTAAVARAAARAEESIVIGSDSAALSMREESSKASRARTLESAAAAPIAAKSLSYTASASLGSEKEEVAAGRSEAATA
jgi:hypothetical protein